VRNCAVAVSTFNPEDLGIAKSESGDLIGGDAVENAALFKAVLSGEHGPKRDIVLVNAAFGICAGGRAETPEEGMELAVQSIDSGSALAKYEALKECSNS